MIHLPFLCVLGCRLIGTSGGRHDEVQHLTNEASMVHSTHTTQSSELHQGTASSTNIAESGLIQTVHPDDLMHLLAQVLMTYFIQLLYKITE
jgi:hypothetical protein